MKGRSAIGQAETGSPEEPYGLQQPEEDGIRDTLVVQKCLPLKDRKRAVLCHNVALDDLGVI